MSIFIAFSGCIDIVFEIDFFNHSTEKIKFIDFDAIVEVIKLHSQIQDFISIKLSSDFQYIEGIFK